VLGPSKGGEAEGDALETAARRVVETFGNWRSKTKPQSLTDAIEELRAALG
jgi:hypothetical protein